LIEGAGGNTRVEPVDGQPLAFNVWATGRANLAG